MTKLDGRSAYPLYVLHKSLETSKIELSLTFDFQVDPFNFRSLLQPPDKSPEFFEGKESFPSSIHFRKPFLHFGVSTTQVQSAT